MRDSPAALPGESGERGIMKPRSMKVVGSRAKGKARPDSDWDILVESDFTSDADTWGAIKFPWSLPQEMYSRIRALAPEGAKLDIFVVFRWGGQREVVRYDSDGQLRWDDYQGCAFSGELILCERDAG